MFLKHLQLAAHPGVTHGHGRRGKELGHPQRPGLGRAALGWGLAQAVPHRWRLRRTRHSAVSPGQRAGVAGRLKERREECQAGRGIGAWKLAGKCASQAGGSSPARGGQGALSQPCSWASLASTARPGRCPASATACEAQPPAWLAGWEPSPAPSRPGWGNGAAPRCAGSHGGCRFRVPQPRCRCPGLGPMVGLSEFDVILYRTKCGQTRFSALGSIPSTDCIGQILAKATSGGVKNPVRRPSRSRHFPWPGRAESGGPPFFIHCRPTPCPAPRPRLPGSRLCGVTLRCGRPCRIRWPTR